MGDENRDNVIGYTLWGDPVYCRAGKRGRPRFERTEENARRVSMLLAMGWGNERIAGCILDPRTGKSISVPTLKRYFRSELAERDRARDRLDARRMMITAEQAFGGNVGAMRLLNQMVEKNDAMNASARLTADPDKGKLKSEPLGKKEQARREAQRVAVGDTDGEWGFDLKPGYEH
ncbi:resolvase [Psychromarinibacter halotolerans]|uniref:Resolvase n=1 Tax=Psychromarinibacter halotolerans TaxID=1775175 RepID=A0ABV7GYC3_9RHOB|nr:resolvase [Psychromarinibacter halotolerans]MDF0598978.1 resolvase [Psychromarinibacter halotolerans]